MTEPQDIKVENAILRGLLWTAVRRLKDFHEAPHFEIEDDGRPMVEVIVPDSLRDKAAEAIEKAEKMLKEPEQGRGR